MKKRPKLKMVLITLLAFLAFTSFNNYTANTAPATDKDIVHVATSNPAADLIEQLKKLLTPIPDYNPFNTVDQMVVDRHTNTFYLYSVSEDAAVTFEHESNLMAANGVKIITINLHSPGGELLAANVMQQQIRILKERGIKIRTVVADHNACMSACPLIFLAGDEKIAYANSVFMFHSPYIQFPYNTSEDVMTEYMRELRVNKDEYSAELVKYCPADPSIKMDIYDHEEHFYRSDALAARCAGGTFFDSIVPVVDQKCLISFGI